MGGGGLWTDTLTNTYSIRVAGGSSFTGTLTTPQCGNYGLAGTRPGGRAFTLSSSNAAPPAGCCSSANWSGNLTSCSPATFSLTSCNGPPVDNLIMTRPVQ